MPNRHLRKRALPQTPPYADSVIRRLHHTQGPPDRSKPRQASRPVRGARHSRRNGGLGGHTADPPPPRRAVQASSVAFVAKTTRIWTKLPARCKRLLESDLLFHIISSRNNVYLRFCRSMLFKLRSVLSRKLKTEYLFTTSRKFCPHKPGFGNVARWRPPESSDKPNRGASPERDGPLQAKHGRSALAGEGAGSPPRDAGTDGQRELPPQPHLPCPVVVDPHPNSLSCRPTYGFRNRVHGSAAVKLVVRHGNDGPPHRCQGVRAAGIPDPALLPLVDLAALVLDVDLASQPAKIAPEAGPSRNRLRGETCLDTMVHTGHSQSIAAPFHRQPKQERQLRLAGRSRAGCDEGKRTLQLFRSVQSFVQSKVRQNFVGTAQRMRLVRAFRSRAHGSVGAAHFPYQFDQFDVFGCPQCNLGKGERRARHEQVARNAKEGSRRKRRSAEMDPIPVGGTTSGSVADAELQRRIGRSVRHGTVRAESAADGPHCFGGSVKFRFARHGRRKLDPARNGVKRGRIARAQNPQGGFAGQVNRTREFSDASRAVECGHGPPLAPLVRKDLAGSWRNRGHRLRRAPKTRLHWLRSMECALSSPLRPRAT